MNSSTWPRPIRFLFRLTVAFVLFSGFFIVTQDFQIFPTLVSSTFGYRSTVVPEGVEQFFSTTVDGKRIDTWRVGASGERLATVIIFRGNADTLNNVSHFQKFLAARGITSYSFDYRGTGRSSGWPSENGIYLDAQAVASEVIEKEKIEKSQISILGISIGTGPSAFLARDLQSSKLVLVAPYHDLRMLVGEMPLFGLLTSFLWYSFPTAHYVASLEHTSVTLFHGTADGTIPIRHSRLIVEEGNPGNRPKLFEVEGAGHNDILGRVASQIADVIVAP